MAIVWIDTHAHLDDPAFTDDLPDVLQRATAAGVQHILTIGTTAASSERAVELAEAYPTLSAVVGIQPNHVAEVRSDDWDRILDLSRRPRVVALGETGLDRHWDFSPFEQQQDFFQRHLEWAVAVQLPVVIHCREAFAETVQMLREHFDRHGPIRGVMHSFTGDWKAAEACLEMGLYISFAGMITYKNADALRQVAAQVPLERLLVETDSPYLVPVPLRGKVRRNEPAHVALSGACLAQLHGIAVERMAEITTANARSLFGIA